MNNYLLFGTIIKTHGICGEVVLHHNFENPMEFSGKLWIDNLPSPTKLNATFRTQLSNGNIILVCSGINSIEEAQRQVLKKTVFIHKDDIPPIENGKFYAFNLIGLKICNAKDGSEIGIVVDIVDFGSGLNFEVKSLQEKLEYYLYDDSTHIDIDNQIITIVLPEYV
ncbi:MAG: 16S rRNA processing protein RimM [Candidatus Deianiraeaceae bacterium]|jgi:16S rRNA processing protein RimM